MGLPIVIVAILDFFEFLWTLFTIDSPKPGSIHSAFAEASGLPKTLRPVNQPLSTKPFRLLHLPSLARNVIFSHMEIADIYHLSKCSCRSWCAVKKFTRRQKYNFTIGASKSFYCLAVSSRCWRKSFIHDLRPLDSEEPLDEQMYVTNAEDYWAATKEEIVYCLNVFTDRVSNLHFRDSTKVIEMTEFLKTVTFSPVEWVSYAPMMPKKMRRYVLKEFESSTVGNVAALHFSEFRDNNIMPCHADYVYTSNADWVTVDHLVRFFLNVKIVTLFLNPKKSLITPALMHRFFNAWRNGSGIEKLEVVCDWTKADLRVMFENVPSTQVKRVEVFHKKKRFSDGECFLIRQEESGVEAIAYMTSGSFILKTGFRLLEDRWWPFEMISDFLTFDF